MLTLGTCALAAAGAEAQYYPPRPGGGGIFTSGLYSTNPYAGGLNSYNFGYNYSFGFNYVNPITGGRTVFQVNRSYAGPSPYGLGGVQNPLINGLGYATPSYRAGYTNPYLGATAAGYANPGPNPIALEQSRLARQAGNATGFDRPPAPKPAPRPVPRDPKPEPPPQLPPADPEAVRSGAAINELIPKLIDQLDATGSRPDSPLIPSELMRNLRYAPGPKADLIGLLRDGATQAPAAFDNAELKPLKTELEKLAEPVAKDVLAGKPTNTRQSEALGKRVETARPEVGKATNELTAPERREATDYLNGLAALAKVDSTPELKGVYAPTFAVVGGSAVDYARYVQKHGLKLAPAPAGSGPAYEALYRALAGTKAGLDRAAK